MFIIYILFVIKKGALSICQEPCLCLHQNDNLGLVFLARQQLFPPHLYGGKQTELQRVQNLSHSNVFQTSQNKHLFLLKRPQQVTSSSVSFNQEPVINSLISNQFFFSQKSILFIYFHLWYYNNNIYLVIRGRIYPLHGCFFLMMLSIQNVY